MADYIPALADVPANQLGIAVYSNEGELFCAGDADTAFSVQSISKVFSLVQAIQHSGEAIWQRLGHEPLWSAVQLAGAAGVRAWPPAQSVYQCRSPGDLRHQPVALCRAGVVDARLCPTPGR